MSLFKPILLFNVYKHRNILEIKLLRSSAVQEKSGEDIFTVYFENQISISIRTILRIFWVGISDNQKQLSDTDLAG